MGQITTLSVFCLSRWIVIWCLYFGNLSQNEKLSENKSPLILNEYTFLHFMSSISCHCQLQEIRLSIIQWNASTMLHFVYFFSSLPKELKYQVSSHATSFTSDLSGGARFFLQKFAIKSKIQILTQQFPMHRCSGQPSGLSLKSSYLLPFYFS